MVRVKPLVRAGAENVRDGHLGVKGEHWVGRAQGNVRVLRLFCLGP